jgi:hypothetical protein
MASIEDMLGFSARTHYDAMNMLLGTPLGYGSARQVYVNDLNPTQVVKVEQAASSFQNVLEWEVWKVVQDSRIAMWFAPCRFISPDGRLLIMDRTQQPSSFPERIPAIFTDLKYTNFGQLGKQFVCHDYGLLRLACGFSTRMRKADWWHVDEFNK